MTMGRVGRRSSGPRALALLVALCALARADDPTPTPPPDLAQTLAAAADGEGARADLARRLEQEAALTLRALPAALAHCCGEADPAEAARVEAALAEQVAAAVGRARDPRAFIAAALRDALPPVMLGVTRGALAALRAPPGPASLDQGAPDWAGFLCVAVAADSTDTRALACEALGLLPPKSAVLEALLSRAEDEPVVRARAQESLARLAGQVKGAREWAEARLLADLTVAGLTSLALADRRARAEGEAAMERALLALPERAIADLDDSLARLEADDGGGASCDVTTPIGVLVSNVVARAVSRAADPAPLLARAAEGHVFLAFGLARGIAIRTAAGPIARRREIASREASVASESGEEAEEPPTEAAERETRVLLEAIEVLASREEPAVRASSLRTAAALLDEPDGAWGERLRVAANHRDPGVRAAAWEARQALLDPRRPSSAAWRAWFAGREREPGR